MRYILRNVVLDKKFERLRRSNPSKNTVRPIIDGRPFPAGATRVLEDYEFTAQMLWDIEDHQSWGNVQLVKVAREGAQVDVFELLSQLRLPPRKAIKVSAAPAPTPAPVVANLVVEVVKEPEASAPVEPTPEEPVLPPEPAPASIDDILDPELPAVPVLTEERLRNLKNEELRGILAKMDRPVTGKNKAELIAEILDAGSK